MTDPVYSHSDLLADPGLWTQWSPRDALSPRFDVMADGGQGGGAVLQISGDGNPLACGCWRLPLGGMEPGRRYRVEAGFRSERVDSPGKSIRAILTCASDGGAVRFWDHLDHAGDRDGWHCLGRDLDETPEASELTLCLYLAWSARGRVLWGYAKLFDVTDAPAGHRTPLIAVVSGNPPSPGSPAECADFYAARIDDVAGQQADLICLPELVNTTGVALASESLAEPVPGPTSDRLASQARTHGCYLAASILERHGEALYNTALVLDRTGGLLGKYRKTHLPLAEGLLSGTTPGDTYPVFHTDFGTIGYMVCYDGHFPEVPRVLALAGAHIILWSNMGDGREGGTLWEPVVRTRAVDNHVFIAAAVNGGRSCVVSPKGEVLAMSDRSPGSAAAARCPLGTSVSDFTGRPIGRRYEQVRRSDTYGPLAADLWSA